MSPTTPDVGASRERQVRAPATGTDDTFEPNWSVAPGVVLLAELNARDMTQSDLAARTGLSAKHINQVIKDVVPLSPDTAVLLERALGVPSRFWMQLAAAHQSRVTQERARADMNTHGKWLERFPLTELIKCGVIGARTSVGERVERLLTFFGVASPDAYEKVWQEAIAGAFRRAQHHQIDPYATAVWIRLGELKADQIETAQFDATAARSEVSRWRRFTNDDDARGFKRVQAACAKVGIAVVFVPEVKGSRANGATRWLSASKPVVILSARYAYADVFWFSFFHELGHVLLHPRRTTFIDLGDGDDRDGRDREADLFACEALLPGVTDDTVRSLRTTADVTRLARQSGVSPGIVAGRFGHLTERWSLVARLRHKIELDD